MKRQRNFILILTILCLGQCVELSSGDEIKKKARNQIHEDLNRETENAVDRALVTATKRAMEESIFRIKIVVAISIVALLIIIALIYYKRMKRRVVSTGNSICDGKPENLDNEKKKSGDDAEKQPSGRLKK